MAVSCEPRTHVLTIRVNQIHLFVALVGIQDLHAGANTGLPYVGRHNFRMVDVVLVGADNGLVVAGFQLLAAIVAYHRVLHFIDGAVKTGRDQSAPCGRVCIIASVDWASQVNC